MSIKLVTDSTSYIDTATQQQLDITIIPLSVHFPDESFREDEVEYDYFYNKIDQEGIIPTSSQPPLGEIQDVFRRLIAQGQQVLAIFISSEMSGAYHTALSARDMVLRENPSARIEILDSRTNCMALGQMVVNAARAAQENQSMDEVVAAAMDTQKRLRFYFVPAGLEYLKKGGRIGGAAALLGSVLQIKPILYVKDGETALFERVRGTRAAIERMLELLDEDYTAFGLSQVIVQHIDNFKNARQLAVIIKKRYGIKPEILPIGPVIGLHVGPGAVSIVYVIGKS